MGPAQTGVRRDSLKLSDVTSVLVPLSGIHGLCSGFLSIRFPKLPGSKRERPPWLDTGTSQCLGRAGREELPGAAGAISRAEDTGRGQSPSM